MIEKFEDIESWKKVRQFTKEIYKITKEGEFARDFGLCDQIRRATVSIMSNIAEGYERGGNREFIQFLSHAKGSAGEVRSQLYVALDAGYISANNFERLSDDLIIISQLIGGLMRYLSKSNMKGNKFK